MQFYEEYAVIDNEAEDSAIFVFYISTLTLEGHRTPNFHQLTYRKYRSVNRCILKGKFSISMFCVAVGDVDLPSVNNLRATGTGIFPALVL